MTEPIYRFIGDDETGAAICRYYCPSCGMEFIRRKPCESHAAKCLVVSRREDEPVKGIELEHVLCGAKDDSECIEKIVAFEEQSIHAVCVPKSNGTWTIWKARASHTRPSEPVKDATKDLAFTMLQKELHDLFVRLNSKKLRGKILLGDPEKKVE